LIEYHDEISSNSSHAMSKQQKTDIEVLQKLRAFCSYRDRAESELKVKARELGVEKDHMEAYIAILQQESFLDDRRFAEVFARSKFRQNKWGKFKIISALSEKRIQSSYVELALAELDPLEYEEVANDLIEAMIIKGKSTDQIFQSMKMKGYEGELIYSLLQKKKLV